MNSLAGTENGSFFQAPDWVNKTKPAGTTPQVLADSLLKVIKPIITLQDFVLSPNLVWFLITVASYVCFPYDLESAKSWATGWILNRVVLNVMLTNIYVGFWYVTLYHLDWAKRKYKPAYRPTTGRMIHNIWYTTLGAIQWSIWEAFFMHMYASGRLPYIADQDAFATWGNAVRMVLWTIAVPVWREFHFYWAHRLLHFRVLYKYVHLLHHRNEDPEPFSGLAMHPIEHLYYLATIAPSLYFMMSPFHFMWNGLHAVISPAAGHSGWEDHWSSDQLHYLHHTKFTCNYGGGGLPLDWYFGTFREKIGTSLAYKGEEGETPVDASSKQSSKRTETTAPLRLTDALPKKEDALYFFTNIIIAAVLFVALRGGEVGRLQVVGLNATGLVVAVGPIAAGFLMRAIFADKAPLTWPFHKESLLGPLGVHLLVGLCVTVIPVYHTVTWTIG